MKSEPYHIEDPNYSYNASIFDCILYLVVVVVAAAVAEPGVVHIVAVEVVVGAG